MDQITIKSLSNEDLPRVHEIQQVDYPAPFHESIDVFEIKLNLYPMGCFGAWIKNQLVGYVFSHPWMVNKEVSLHETELKLPSHPNCLYVHDMTIDPAFRKQGVGSLLWYSIQKFARDMKFHSVTLVAVLGAETFWQRLGFFPIHVFHYIDKYNGIYMIRKDQLTQNT